MLVAKTLLTIEIDVEGANAPEKRRGDINVYDEDRRFFLREAALRVLAYTLNRR
jgi:hypothetical protein